MKRNSSQLDLFERPPALSLEAVTVWAPFSILIAKGLKRFETRSWPLPARLIGQRLAIHSAVRAPSRSDCTPAERAAIEVALGVPAQRWATLPRSVIVATVRIVGCYQIAQVDGGRLYVAKAVPGSRSARSLDIQREAAFGDFSVGRWVWVLGDLETFAPIPHRGTQGLWTARL